MEFIETILKQIWSFFSLEGLIEIIKSGDFQSLLTYQGISRAIAPLLPVILVLALHPSCSRKYESKCLSCSFFSGSSCGYNQNDYLYAYGRPSGNVVRDYVHRWNTGHFHSYRRIYYERCAIGSCRKIHFDTFPSPSASCKEC